MLTNSSSEKFMKIENSSLILKENHEFGEHSPTFEKNKFTHFLRKGTEKKERKEKTKEKRTEEKK